jgi:flavodoxin
MAKLVAFYSRAEENYFGGQYRYIEVGNTEKVAHLVAKITGAELLKIEQAVLYSAKYQTCIEEAKRDLNAKKRPELVNLPADLDTYDEIYLGYPNYWGTMPMAVYTFLEHYAFAGKTIHPFCTHEGSGLSGTVKDIEKACKDATVTKGLAIQGSNVDHAEALVRDWIDKFGGR